VQILHIASQPEQSKRSLANEILLLDYLNTLQPQNS
jgi:hypothetical protein